MKKHLLIFIFILAMSEFAIGASLYSAPILGAVRFVTENGEGSKNGTSWGNAYDNTQLQTAINETNVSQVWVAAGTYKPTLAVGGTGTLYQAFQMKNEVAIYGGFAGSETLLSERNWTTNLTILSGDLAGDDVINGSGASLLITGNTENCYHVFNHPSTLALTSSAILDGFTIKGGNASGAKGGGMFNTNSSPTIANCIFTSNSSYNGGGISNNDYSSPTLTNCKISGNYSIYGGGVDNYLYSSPTLTNCTIADNYAGYSGGGVYMQYHCSVSLINCLIVFNNAAFDGGGVYGINYNIAPSLTNCTVSGNSAGRDGGGLFCSALTTVNNSIIWGNTALTSGHQIYNSGYATSLNNSCYENGSGDVVNVDNGGTITPANCITTDPQFINPNTDFRIAGTSPCADAGSNSYNTEDYDIRGAGFGRKLLKTNASTPGTIDMGAYEYNNGIDPAVPAVLRLYVKSDALGSNDGSSWTNAYKSLQDAIAAAGRHYEIWVAKGTYKPTTGTDRTISFTMKTALAIYGGFAGNETALSARNWTTNPTILSGDLNGDDVVSGSGATLSISGKTENSYHVVNVPSSVAMTSRSVSPAILDGFTIQGGNANGGNAPTNYGGGVYTESVAATFSSFSMVNCIVTANSASYGGAMFNDYYSSPTLTNCSITNNLGTNVGGIYNYYINSTTLTNCTISGNSSTNYSGGLNNQSYSTLVMVNCKISNNSTANGNGGGLSNSGTSSANLTNCLITNNSAGIWGGGMYNNSSTLVMNNCTLSGNSIVNTNGGGGGGGIYIYYSSVTINNTIIWGNSSIYCPSNTSIITSNQIYNYSNATYPVTLNNSCYANGAGDVYNYSGGIITPASCITSDPQFINPNTDFRIALASPCADAGSNSYNSETYDIRGIGFGRKLLKTNASTAGTIDMGAYEYKNGADPAVPEVLRLYVKSDGNDSNNGSSWPNAFKSLQAALTAAGRNYEIWVAAGTYTPSLALGGTGSRYQTFQMKNKLAIYGGFAGTETLLSQRNWKTNVTVLSGDLNANDVVSGSGKTLSISGNTENCYHVITSLNYVDGTAILDGFTIKGGNASGNYGGGVYNYLSSPTLNNCNITANSANYGAGIGNYQYSSPLISNCTISENYNLYYGGGICNETFSSPVLVNCTISGNYAVNNGGGGMMNYSNCSPTLTNCLIVNNYSGIVGGAFYNYVSSPTLTNCTVSGNSAATDGGGLYNNTNSTVTLNNSIIWGNTASTSGNQIYNSNNATSIIMLNYSCYANGTGDVFNGSLGTITPSNCINITPRFVNASTGDFRIFNISKCADAGLNSYNNTTTDIRGTGFGRKMQKTDHTLAGTIDMGAYEYQESIDWGNPTIGGVIAGPASVCYGSASPEITNTTLPSGHVGTLEYKWQISTTSSTSGFADVASTNSPTYSPGVLTVPTWFKRLSKITLINDWEDAAVSNVWSISIDPVSVGGNVSGSTEVCSGTNSTPLTLSGQTGNVIKWQSSTDNWATFTDVVNATTTLTANNLTITTKYHAVVQSGVCDPKNSSDATVTVNPLPAAVAGANRAICLNSSTQIGAAAVTGSTYNWTSVPAGFTSILANPTVSPTVATIYSVIETIIATGCTNTHSVTVTVNPLPAAVAGSDRAICLNSNTQLGAASVAGSTYSWTSVPAGYTSTLAIPTVSPTVTTIYTVVETTTLTGCTNTHSVTVTVNPLPAAFAGADRAICLNSNTQLGAASVAGSTYSWTSVPAGFTSILANPTVSPAVNTIYTVIETTSLTGCTNTHSVTVTVNPLPAAVAGADRAITINTSTTIGAPWVSGSTYSWTSNPAGFSSELWNPTVSPLVTTTYTVTETNSNGCTNSHSVKVTVNAAFTASVSISVDANNVCEGTSVKFTAIPTNEGTNPTYQWYKNSALVGTASTYSYTPVNGDQVYVMMTSNLLGVTGSPATSNVVDMTVNPLPEAVAGAGRAICLNSETQLGGASVAGSTYSWTSVPAGFTSTQANPIVSPAVTTSYSVVETTSTGCTNTHSVIVTVNPLPAAVAGADRTITKNTSTQIGAAPVSGSEYSWTSDQTNYTSTEANPTVSPLLTTTYTVVETINSTGCTNNHSVTVTVNEALTASVHVGVDANNVCEGTSVIFTATPTNGGTNPGYQWYKNTALAGTGLTYSYTPVNGDQVYVMMTSNLPGVTGSPATSNKIDLFVNTNGQWLGITSDWNDASNWCGGVPTATTNVTIPSGVIQPIIGVSVSASCNDINIEDGAILTLNSDENGTGSFIAETVTGVGSANVYRYMTTDAWHIVSSPVSGQSISAFLTANNNVARDDADYRGMMDYNPQLNNWNDYFTNSTSGNLGGGKGFCMRTNANSAVIFTGNLQAGDQSVSDLAPDMWNCVGNPYTSAIGINNLSSSASRFIEENASNLDLSFGAIYIWDNLDINNGLAGKYTIISNTPNPDAGFDVQQGQAFMVKMNTTATSVGFNSGMQIHSPGLALKSTKDLWPAFKLVATVNGLNATTLVAFNSAMTKGLDPTYDAGLLKNGSDLEIYSRLVDDNGIAFAIQALPSDQYESMVIPIGIDSNTGGEISFSSELINLTSACKVILEDKINKTFTDLSKTMYSTTIAANSSIADRFQIHTSYMTTGLDKSNFEGQLSAYAIRNVEIKVKGNVSNQAVATLYDVQGRAILVKNLEAGSLNTIRTPNLRTGIYLLYVRDNNKLQGFKIPVIE